MKYILALNQTTTSSKSALLDQSGAICAASQKDFKTITPQPGWVEHDPLEIWDGVKESTANIIKKLKVSPQDIQAIGIANQRESVVLWDRQTGEPICNVISWQDRRAAGLCAQFKKNGINTTLRAKTGLMMIPYFSATKILWALDNVPGAREKAERGELAFGTLDSWLVWKLTGGKLHITDASNAARTLLFNIHTLAWDEELLELFNIPRSILPEVRDSSEVYGEATELPGAEGVVIAGIAGDQQAALFGNGAIEAGSAKLIYYTSNLCMLNTGHQAISSTSRLLTTIAWKIDGKATYALEGLVFTGGAVIQWLRDQLGIINSASEVEALASQVSDNGGVHFIPAFAGLGAPHWNTKTRGTITGLSRNTGKAHIARASLEAISFQTQEVLQSMEMDYTMPITSVRVSGKAARNNLLMQLQANDLQIPVIRLKESDPMAVGAACLAGLATGFWSSIEEIQRNQKIDQIFEPQISADEASKQLNAWQQAIAHAQALDTTA